MRRSPNAADAEGKSLTEAQRHGEEMLKNAMLLDGVGKCSAAFAR
jgi:hypothetical protein